MLDGNFENFEICVAERARFSILKLVLVKFGRNFDLNRNKNRFAKGRALWCDCVCGGVNQIFEMPIEGTYSLNNIISENWYHIGFNNIIITENWSLWAKIVR